MTKGRGRVSFPQASAAQPDRFEKWGNTMVLPPNCPPPITGKVRATDRHTRNSVAAQATAWGVTSQRSQNRRVLGRDQGAQEPALPERRV